MPKVRAFIAAAACLVAGCAYDPPMQADHDSAAYQADRAACQDKGSEAAYKRAVATFPLFVTYPISLPILIRIETRKCLEAKGYKLET